MLTLGSTTIAEGGTFENEQVFNGFGYAGENISPELHWSGAPAETKSFALTIHDPDAPTGSGWWHWVVYNIPATVTSLPEGAGDPAKGLAPAGVVQGLTDFGAPGYGGPCPPKGDKPHRYVVTIFAVDVPSFELPDNATPAMVGFNLHFHTLEKASFTAYFGS